MRTEALAKPEVGDFLSKHFVSVYDRVGTFTVSAGSDGKNPNKNGGNVAAFLCSPGGHVIHTVAGPRTAESFLAEVKWAVAVYSQILADRGIGLRQSQVEKGSRVATALRQAHANALLALMNPDQTPAGMDLIRYEPSSDPKLKGLEAGGRKQREQVHRLLKDKAFEPLAVVGPEIYTHVLGERVTGEPVRLSGAPEARQAAGAGKNLLEFFTKSESTNSPRSAEPPAQPATSTRRSPSKPK